MRTAGHGSAQCLSAAAVLVAALMILSSPARAVEPDFDATTGYRTNRYRAPVPETVPGATRVSAPDVTDLVKHHAAVLIDVMASEGAGPDPATGEWRLTKPRQNIPGSIWLPDVGRGQVTPVMDAYFQETLKKYSAGNKDQPIIIYCQADCWMSWNAVKRASSYGYSSLYWFAEGSDGWRDWDGPLVDASPIPLSRAALDAR